MPIRRNIPLAREHFDKALEYYSENDPRAIKHANIAIARDVRWSRPHWLLGVIYSTVPPIRLELAIQEFREVTLKEPTWPKGHFNLGKVLAMQGRIDEAMIVLRQALKLEPHAVWTRIELARCLLKRCDYREAITVLRGRPSLSHYYTVADAHLLLAEALAGSHYVKQARAEWEAILRLDETIPAYRVAQTEARRRLLETDK